MTIIVCERCYRGNVEASPFHRGWGICCAPDPLTRAEIAADAAARHNEALRAAERSDWRSTLNPGGWDAQGPAEGPEEPVSPPRLTVVNTAPPVWMLTAPHGLAHLFVPGNERSCCRKVHILGAQRAPAGLPGCRLCAASVGLTNDRSEVARTG